MANYQLALFTLWIGLSPLITSQHIKQPARLVPRTRIDLTEEQLMEHVANSMNQTIGSETESLPVNCGQSNLTGTDRIVGGNETAPNEFPWQVALLIRTQNGQYQCGGSLISTKLVLTAAHCVDGASNVYVYLGAHNLKLQSEPNRLVILANKFYIHPTWNPDVLEGDVALIELPIPVQFNNYIRPICLAPVNDDYHVDDGVILTGWGRFSDSSDDVSPVLRKAYANVISNSECSQTFDITDRIICTEGNGSSTCNGDSGGPLQYRKADGTFLQIGIVSFGAAAGCEKGYPNGFSRVRSYRSWIDTIANSYSGGTSRSHFSFGILSVLIAAICIT